MKKLLVALFAILYMSTSIGASVQLHYCMGKLAGWGIGHQTSGTCGECGMEKKSKESNSCCSDEHKFFKNDADQKISESAFHCMQAMAVSMPVSFFEITAIHLSSITEDSPVSHAPPQPGSIAVYIRNCVFLI